LEHNPVFETAVDFVNNTNCNIFLTGKAGSGKTTFLRYIKENTKKKNVVVAPTGVAAINAGGVTMHSFFQLPFSPYLPSSTRSSGAIDKYALIKNIRFDSEKREMLRDLQLLIIDEVSMVRCDVLDAVDDILRFFRKKPHKVFGGVQVLFIGDMFQLPPVMPDTEWSILKEHYISPFFFHARAVEQCSLIYLELKKIYRQNEQRFIEILNRVRNDEVTSSDLEILNSRYNAPQIPEKKYITLTSHNYKADRINHEELQNLEGKVFGFDGVVEGDFPEKLLPTDRTLQLKIGAQVMFLRNDKSEENRFYNGKIGTVNRIEEYGIYVGVNDSEHEVLLEKEIWENIQYSYNRLDHKIEAVQLGTFSQFPIRLAWAITIHKSQGLTFENAIIDAGESFAAGQVYVALSRCVSLEGMILHSKIDHKSISTHKEVVTFAGKEKEETALEKILREERHVFTHSTLLQTFDFHHFIETIEDHIRQQQRKKKSEISGALAFGNNLLKAVEELQSVAVKFQLQLETLLKENDFEKLRDRVTKAIEYFSGSISEQVLKKTADHLESLKGKKKVKKYQEKIRQLRTDATSKVLEIQNAHLGEISLNASDIRIQVDSEVEVSGRKNKQGGKGESLKETLTHFQSGLTIPEIAKKRSLTAGTIFGHVAALVRTGDIEIYKVVDKAKCDLIQDAIQNSDTSSIGEIKRQLPEDCSYGEIRAVINHLLFIESRDGKGGGPA
jgi:ATP-dependent exoDNAse (exonuclease V) alpha subunit